MIWSRFINTHGTTGKNIPADQHMEHLNRIVKEAIKNLGANKTEIGFIRVGKAIGTIIPLVEKFDEIHSVHTLSSTHKCPIPSTDVCKLVKELNSIQVFVDNQHKRYHNSFMSITQNCLKTNQSKLNEWIEQKVN